MSKRSALYAVEDGKLVRKNEHCPKCGPGVFLAKHADRSTCGRCGWDATRLVAATTDSAADDATSEED